MAPESNIQALLKLISWDLKIEITIYLAILVDIEKAFSHETMEKN